MVNMLEPGRHFLCCIQSLKLDNVLCMLMLIIMTLSKLNKWLIISQNIHIFLTYFKIIILNILQNVNQFYVERVNYRHFALSNLPYPTLHTYYMIVKN